MNMLPLNSENLPNLTLLVNQNLGRLEGEVRNLRSTRGWPVLSLSRALAQKLSDLPARRRSTAVRTLLEEAIGQLAVAVVLCTDLGLLFDPDLKLDPLALLRHLSRGSRLIVAWPGSYQGSILACAVPAHAHYRTWSDMDTRDVSIVSLR